VLFLLRALLFGWAVSLITLVKLLCSRCHGRPKTGDERIDRAATTDCVPIDHPSFVRPDPLIYCQRKLIDLGLAVTWDNPDVVLFRNGAPVDSHDLDPATTYQVQARIWNDSFDAPVVDMPVHLSYLDFGIGTEPIPIASGKVDVGVKGGAGQPGFITLPWTTPPTAGHYCLQVLLDPADDKDRSNNLGQENADVRAAQSPASFEFTLRNNTLREQLYRFETDAYQLPGREPCQQGQRNARQKRLERHRRGNHPVPAGFTVDISPAAPPLSPGQAVTVQVSVDPPASFTGAQQFNVNAFHQYGFAGGVTLTVVKGP
jgi:hypothetical protein